MSLLFTFQTNLDLILKFKYQRFQTCCTISRL
eukprot:UN20134